MDEDRQTYVKATTGDLRRNRYVGAHMKSVQRSSSILDEVRAPYPTFDGISGGSPSLFVQTLKIANTMMQEKLSYE
jgi:hypothetical protein